MKVLRIKGNKFPKGPTCRGLRDPSSRGIEETAIGTRATDEIRCIPTADRVIVLKNGVLIGDLQWENACELGVALYHAGKRAEQFAKRDYVEKDALILNRAGIDGKRLLGDAIGIPTLILPSHVKKSEP